MPDYVRIKLDVQGTNAGEVIRDVPAYLPFEGADFAAQQHIKIKGLWLIVHVRTTAMLPSHVAQFDTRDEALVAAGRLSRECPAAAHVYLDADHKVSGPFPKMREEVLASLRPAA